MRRHVIAPGHRTGIHFKRIRWLGRLHTWDNVEFSLEEVSEGAASGFKVVAVLVHKVDRDVQGVLYVPVEAKTLLKDKGQDSCSVGIHIRPDMAAPTQKACSAQQTVFNTAAPSARKGHSSDPRALSALGRCSSNAPPIAVHAPSQTVVLND